MSKGILDWPAENIQATVFIPGQHSQSASNLFEIAFETAPTNSQESINPQFGRLGSASRQTGQTGLSVNLQPGRCDIAISSVHDAAKFDATGKIINFADSLEVVRAASIKAAKAIGVASRLAISVRLALGHQNRQDANKALLGVMPYKLILSDEEDFILQANWQTVIGGRKINRLIRWSSETVVITIEQGFIGQAPQVINKEAIISVVALDFNSWPGHTKFTADQSAEVLDTLAAELVKARKNEFRFKQ